MAFYRILDTYYLCAVNAGIADNLPPYNEILNHIMFDVKYRRPADWDYKLEENGKFYGFPSCCIREFIDRGINRTQAQLKTANHGFFPCDHHAQEILAGKITLSGLIQNRICSTPFPND